MNLMDRMKKSWDIDFKSLKAKGINSGVVHRFGHADMAYPCSLGEYIALRGCVVVMMGVLSDNKNEVPIRRAYFESDYVELSPMRQMNVCVDGADPIRDQVQEIKGDEGKIYFQNISFWAFPLAWFGNKWKMGVDFKIERNKFGILSGTKELPGLVSGWVEKERSKQIKVAEDFDNETFGRFIQREFFHSK